MYRNVSWQQSTRLRREVLHLVWPSVLVPPGPSSGHNHLSGDADYSGFALAHPAANWQLLGFKPGVLPYASVVPGRQRTENLLRASENTESCSGSLPCNSLSFLNALQWVQRAIAPHWGSEQFLPFSLATLRHYRFDGCQELLQNLLWIHWIRIFIGESLLDTFEIFQRQQLEVYWPWKLSVVIGCSSAVWWPQGLLPGPWPLCPRTSRGQWEEATDGMLWIAMRPGAV